MSSSGQSPAGVSSGVQGVRIERTAEVLTFTLDSPQRGNEVTGAMFDAMLVELRSESPTPRARVLRLRANGRVFCAGRERAGSDRESIRAEAVRLIEFLSLVRTLPLVSVAEVQGDAFGFGFGLAIVCDFVLVAETASLAFPEMRSGLPPSAIMAYLGEYALPRHVFPLALLGDGITPHRALQIGLISQVCSREHLTGEANALVERVLRLDADAARGCKRFFAAAQQNWFEQNCRQAVEALTEGTLAMLAKQK